jgi:hypothetical protein
VRPEGSESGKGDAASEVTFPRGVRGLNFWLEGVRAEQFDVVYKILLSNGATMEGRNGSRIGYWYPSRSSTQHQLVWLENFCGTTQLSEREWRAGSPGSEWRQGPAGPLRPCAHDIFAA